MAARHRTTIFAGSRASGPKFADALQAQGFARFEQLAQLTPTEIERLDSQLGAFRGRITRDRIVEQADYLARGDTDGFEQTVRQALADRCRLVLGRLLARARRDQLVDLAAVHVDDLERPAVVTEFLAGLRQVLEHR